MAARFTRTLRSLEADGYGGTLAAVVVAAALLGAWMWWFFGSSVPLYETSGVARLEVEQAAHAVQSPIDGQVVSSSAEVGRVVTEGQVLFELDAEMLKRQRGERLARIAGLEREVERVDGQLAAEARAASDLEAAASAAEEEAEARAEAAQERARFARDEAKRLRDLFEQRAGARTEADRAAAEAAQLEGLARAARLAVAQTTREYRARVSVQAVQTEELRRERERLGGEIATLLAAMDRLDYEIETHRVLAPVAGRIGEVATLGAGAFVKAGEQMASVVPSGAFRVVAQFPPDRALGRVRKGQRARLRLYGFPWGQYGSVAARVASVATEPRAGTVRIELALDGAGPESIPVQHGLPGSIEIEVEEVTPAELVLRLAGKSLDGREAGGSLAP